MSWGRVASVVTYLLLGAALGFAALVFAFGGVAAELLDRTVFISTNPDYPSMSPVERDVVARLAARNLLLTGDQLVSILAAFYETLIVALTVLLGALGVTAYFSVRSLSIGAAQDMVRETAKEYFVGSRDINDRLNAAVERNYAERHGRALEQIETLQDRVAQLESLIAELDDDESGGGESVVIAPGNEE